MVLQVQETRIIGVVDASEDLQSHRVKEVIPVSLDRIVKRFRLKRRTETVCQSNGLTDLRKIYQFKIEYGDFKKLRGCGATTEAELERVFLHALEIRALDDLDMEGSSQGDRLTKIPADLHDHFGQLSVRARNAMIAYSGEDDQDALIRVIAYSDIDLLKDPEHRAKDIVGIGGVQAGGQDPTQDPPCDPERYFRTSFTQHLKDTQFQSDPKVHHFARVH